MNTPPHRPCAVIPVYNHGATVGAVVAALAALELPCVLVDDGSRADCAAVLDTLAGPGVTLVRRAVNGGKGAAVRDGLRAAAQAGYTHALQVDADGQHDLADALRLLQTSRAHPDALIGGLPVYGADVPRARLYGRWLTRVWVWINTLSRDIPDAMCGFRVYPLARVLPVLPGCGARMDFDIAVLVRLHWAGVPMRWLPTQVRYPEGGISHFRGLADNLLISRMHARLFFGMLLRSPRLLVRRLGGRPT
ncbi:glycosyltransferase family 2 protein [Pseudothauera rhizosphaerae]|uniref:Glycosyltransferase family 2 protein n=1 Tax=Pseudothauera rhizosphaerae TaxID=2565932 RepID=A0A4S4ARQ5_9RHOO|nr:glycosyltransferase family 2 protein [Pseudothauera rhizosphaerae]THF62501.1 glycosyltransferase family 2 protein [Pseudothauera rhizosphaerae]